MPTVVSGKLSTYNLTAGLKLDFEDTIHLITPTDVPLLAGVDGSGRSMIAKGTCFEKKVQWQDEELLVQKSTVASAYTAGGATLTVATGDGGKFDAGDLLAVESEVFLVTSVAGDVLTVTGGMGDTSGENHEVGDEVVGLGQYLSEGSDPNQARAVDRLERYNLTQIFGPWKVHTTGSEDAVAKYGLTSSEFDHQVANRLKEMWINVEHACWYGERLDDGANKRAFGGMRYFITTNVDSSTTSLDETKLLDMLQSIFDAGGNPDRIGVGAKQKRVISGFGSSNIRYSQGETRRGQTVESYLSDFGELTVVLDRRIKKEDLFIWGRDQAELDTLRPIQFEMLAKTGDATPGQVVGEKTFKFRRQQHAGRFNALT